MNTCENCGADAVDARGVCRNCGWRARDARGGVGVGIGSSPSLGETRAADMPATRGTPGTPISGAGRGDTAAIKYCGACGAAIEPGHAYCGQCGTPVRAGTVTSGDAPFATSQAPSAPPSGGNRFRVGSDQSWQSEDMNAPTEQFTGLAPGVGGYGRSGVRGGLVYQGSPYGRPSYASGADQQAGAPDSSRTLRLVIGSLCLVGSLISGVAAIILAIIR